MSRSPFQWNLTFTPDLGSIRLLAVCTKHPLFVPCSFLPLKKYSSSSSQAGVKTIDTVKPERVAFEPILANPTTNHPPLDRREKQGTRLSRFAQVGAAKIPNNIAVFPSLSAQSSSKMFNLRGVTRLHIFLQNHPRMACEDIGRFLCYNKPNLSRRSIFTSSNAGVSPPRQKRLDTVFPSEASSPVHVSPPPGPESSTDDSRQLEERASQAGPSSEVNTTLLLADLKSLQAIAQSSERPSSLTRVDGLWDQWHAFLKTPPGKLVDQDVLHNVTRAVLFLRPGRIPKLVEDIEEQQSWLIRFEPRTLRAVGFAALKSQQWSVLCRLIGQQDLESSDLVALVKSASRKILFSSTLKDQAARVKTVVALCEAVARKLDKDPHSIPLMADVIPVLGDPLMKLGCIDFTAEFTLQALRKHPALADSLRSTFLHRVMRTCASHQQLPQAHLLLAELPPGVQTLDQFKACMAVWDRRSPRPLIHSACSVWDALERHPHLSPDHEAYDMYLSLKSRLGHVEDVARIVNHMDRLGFRLNEKTHGLLLHSVGQRRGVQSAWEALPDLVEKGYQPDTYTSNILLSAKARLNDRETRQGPPNAEDRERAFISTMNDIRAANFKSDEVTRNIVVRAFLSRAPAHPPAQIWALKDAALTQAAYDAQLDRQEFRRFRKPLYSMLCSALKRAGSDDDALKMEEEWRAESRKARQRPLVSTEPTTE